MFGSLQPSRKNCRVDYNNNLLLDRCTFRRRKYYPLGMFGFGEDCKVGLGKALGGCKQYLGGGGGQLEGEYFPQGDTLSGGWVLAFL